jgi:hypothetical protein
MKKFIVIAAIALALIAGFAPKGENLADPPPGGSLIYPPVEEETM